MEEKLPVKGPYLEPLILGVVGSVHYGTPRFRHSGMQETDELERSKKTSLQCVCFNFVESFDSSNPFDSHQSGRYKERKARLVIFSPWLMKLLKLFVSLHWKSVHPYYSLFQVLQHLTLVLLLT